MKRLKTIYISAPEMNEVLKWNDSRMKFYRGITPEDRLNSSVFIEDKRVELKVTCRYHGEAATWACRKDEKPVYSSINGADAYVLLQRDYSFRKKCKIPKWKDQLPEQTAEAILAYRKDSDKRWFKAYGYDMNAAYCWGLSQPMPDTRELIGERRIVQEGEIGFYVTEWAVRPKCLPDGFQWAGIEADAMYIAYPGQWARWIFKEEESPFLDFAQRWYERKLNAKDPVEKQKCKDMVNFAVGYLQRVNPFLRATVIERVNKRILDSIDEHTIYCNTDSIISETKRDDLICGYDPGLWHEEHVLDPFAHVGFSYQWMDEVHYRGIPQSWFGKDYDIVTDPIPDDENNIWYYDIWKNKLIRRK